MIDSSEELKQAWVKAWVAYGFGDYEAATRRFRVWLQRFSAERQRQSPHWSPRMQANCQQLLDEIQRHLKPGRRSSQQEEQLKMNSAFWAGRHLMVMLSRQDRTMEGTVPSVKLLATAPISPAPPPPPVPPPARKPASAPPAAPTAPAAKAPAPAPIAVPAPVPVPAPPAPPTPVVAAAAPAPKPAKEEAVEDLDDVSLEDLDLSELDGEGLDLGDLEDVDLEGLDLEGLEDMEGLEDLEGLELDDLDEIDLEESV